MISPICFTASILIPVLVVATDTDAHTRSVTERASGRASNNVWSPLEIPL